MISDGLLFTPPPSPLKLLMKILALFGTRPEAIKMAPVVNELSAEPSFDVKVCVTGQHRQMLDHVLEFFEIIPDFDLDIMQPDQDLSTVTSEVLLGLRKVFNSFRPDIVLVHGDTTTCFAGALASFYAEIPIGHVEAGLRTGDLSAPFPEEANRLLTTKLSTLHFAPTLRNRANLLNESVPINSIIVTGNTVVDALLTAKKRVRREQIWNFSCYGSSQEILAKKQPYVLVTGHRRENFGTGFKNICMAISELAVKYPQIHFVYPVHLNPHVQQPVNNYLGNRNNIHLLSPQQYAPFVYLMDNCLFILTDSGGIQEEAPSLGKKVLVMRTKTERPEALVDGRVALVGTEKEVIISKASELLDPSPKQKATIKSVNPYGDGKAATRIRAALKNYYCTM